MSTRFTIKFYTSLFTILLISFFTEIAKVQNPIINRKDPHSIILLSETEYELIDETIGIDSITILS